MQNLLICCKNTVEKKTSNFFLYVVISLPTITHAFMHIVKFFLQHFCAVWDCSLNIRTQKQRYWPVSSSLGQEPSSQARQVYSSNTNSFSLQGVHVQQQLTSPLRITCKRSNKYFIWDLCFHSWTGMAKRSTVFADMADHIHQPLYFQQSFSFS